MSTVDIDKEYGKPPQAIKACIYHMRPEKAKIQELLAIQKSTLKAELLAKMPKPKQMEYMKEHPMVTQDDETRCRYYRYGGYDFALREITKLVESL